MSDEFDLYKRRIAFVLHYFDEARDLPWDYVLRTDDGRFEAIACLLLDDLNDPTRSIVREHSVGIFDNCDIAVHALKSHLKAVDAADRASWHTADGKLDLNPPTQH